MKKMSKRNKSFGKWDYDRGTNYYYEERIDTI